MDEGRPAARGRARSSAATVSREDDHETITGHEARSNPQSGGLAGIIGVSSQITHRDHPSV